MRFSEILEARVDPRSDIIESMKNLTDIAYHYMYVDPIDDLEAEDSPEDLALLLTYAETLINKSDNKIFTFSVVPSSENAVTTFIHSASVLDDGSIHYNIAPDYIEKRGLIWERFVEEILHITDHEAVHMTQRDKMGADFWASDKRTSGYQLSQQHKIDDKSLEADAERMQLYISDPQELMAHAKDLSNEIKMSDDPITVLRSPEDYIDNLPTWKKYRNAGFKLTDPTIKKLLKFTYNYIKTA